MALIWAGRRNGGRIAAFLISPLRGNYLFTNRQGQKALSMTAEDLADRFRADRARVVEAEPLIDRAFTSMISQIEDKFPEGTLQ